MSAHFTPSTTPQGRCCHLPVLEIRRPKLREVQQLARDLTASDWGTEMLIWVSQTPEAPLPPETERSAEGGRQAPSRTCRMEFQPCGISRSKGHTALDQKAHALGPLGAIFGKTYLNMMRSLSLPM